MGCCIPTKEISEKSFPLNSSTPLTKLTLDSFNIERVIGRGAFGKVFLVTKKDTNQVYAMKCYKKLLIEEQEQKVRVKNEREILQELNHPFLVNLKFAFQTDEKLYLVMDFIAGGELFYHLKKNKRFTEEKVRFYSAEILIGLNYLHQSGIVYRDLKPENILLDSQGHVKITDFGLSKKLREKTFSFCGTPEYLAPEILKEQGHDHSVDYWSLGILIYEMLSGTPPFVEANQQTLYQKILKDTIPMKSYFSNQVINLLNSLLIPDPKLRLSDYERVKKNPFFEGIKWKALENKEITPPYVPRIIGSTDVRNFDKEFTDHTIESYESGKMSSAQKFRNKFEGFSYNPIL